MTFEQDLQLTYFILCFAFGYFFGLLSFFFDGFLISSTFNIAKQLAFFIRIALLSFFFVCMKNAYGIGQVRLYMPTACLLGFYAYLKTIGKIIAIFIKKVYNIVVIALINGRKRVYRGGKS